LAKLSLKKTDQFSKYVFEYSWTMREADEATNKIVNDIKVSYDTPGSAIVRRSSLDVKVDSALSYVAVGVEIPVNKVRHLRNDKLTIFFNKVLPIRNRTC